MTENQLKCMKENDGQQVTPLGGTSVAFYRHNVWEMSEAGVHLCISNNQPDTYLAWFKYVVSFFYLSVFYDEKLIFLLIFVKKLSSMKIHNYFNFTQLHWILKVCNLMRLFLTEKIHVIFILIIRPCWEQTYFYFLENIKKYRWNIM